MEFHDILHGLIRFDDENLTPLLAELIDSPEIHRLRNMRQMNFDVPLIQELGRSRRLPHSIGVAHIAVTLAHRCLLDSTQTKILLAAALLHDAAIPPYGHLVESEFKSKNPGFNHEGRLEELIRGTINAQNLYLDIVPDKQLRISAILDKYDVPYNDVLEVVCPKGNQRSPISADIDIDNIDNVHRMAAMLGWDGVRENISGIINSVSLDGLSGMIFSQSSIPYLEKWLDYRQKIYTLIIAHPACVPYNALQADMVRIAVENELIKPDDWWLDEPRFEERLRNDPLTKELAKQLISGCTYQLVDYVWFKGFPVKKKLNNAQIVKNLSEVVELPDDYGYFVWNEKGLISREVLVPGKNDNSTLGRNSTSCMIALVKKTSGKGRWSKLRTNQWRTDIAKAFMKQFETEIFEVDFPETYTGNYLSHNNELQFGNY